MLTAAIASRRSKAAGLGRELDPTGLVAALGPDLTGRIHYAYKRAPDRRWWRRWYPGWSIPTWDHVSLCGRKGLVVADPPREVDCAACQRILASRGTRLARRAGT